MNVYQKLNEARMRFHSAELKKSGHNKFAGYSYFELSDFVVPALQIFNDLGLCPIITFNAEMAQLRIINADKVDEFVIFSCPVSEANLKGCHPVQNLGAVQTYTRRYLWTAALEIVEHDALDASAPIKDKGEPLRVETVSREAPGKALRIKPLPDPDLPQEAMERVQEVVTDILIAHEEGRELDSIELFYHQLVDNDEKIFAWNLLAPHSKLRAFLKANRPQTQAA